jgi:hypothetical protein
LQLADAVGRLVPILLVVGASACAVNDELDPADRWNEGQSKGGKADLSDPRLVEVYRDAVLHVVAEQAGDAPILKSRVVPELEDAYAFDTSYQQWGSEPALAKPFEAAVATDDTMKAITGQAGGGIAWDPDSFITDRSILSTTPSDVAFEAFVVAHELEHLHMERLGASEPQVPIYAFEGIACVLGDWYVDLRRVAGWNTWFVNEAKGLAAMTGADGSDLFTNFSTSYGEGNKLYWREHVGGLFFEFVRAHVVSNPDDVLIVWGRLTLAMAKGATFENAFADAYGMPLATARDQFVAFLDATVHDPHTRFRGTVWEGFEPQ